MRSKAKRIVVKVGTSSLTHPGGKLDLERIEKLVRVLANVKNAGHQVVLVSSGAIGAGMGVIGLEEKPDSLKQKQALAAIGQVGLLAIYDKFFKEYGYNTGQVLLTKFILDEETRYNCARRAFDSMIDYGVVPIVNENDVISTYEIEFGDNDTLSAYVAELIRADLLIVLSDIDGFFDADPRQSEEAKIIPVVKKISDEIKSFAGAEGSSRGTGGMKTKLKAADFATRHGIDMVLTNGNAPENIYKILKGESVGTLFLKK